jgi:hypothetical protein
MDWNWNQFSLIKIDLVQVPGSIKELDPSLVLLWRAYFSKSSSPPGPWIRFQPGFGTRTTDCGTRELGKHTQHQYLPSWDDLADLVNYLKGIVWSYVIIINPNPEGQVICKKFQKENWSYFFFLIEKISVNLELDIKLFSNSNTGKFENKPKNH